MAASTIVASLGSRAAVAARSSLLPPHAKAVASRVLRAAFSSAVNNGDAAPAMGSEDRERTVVGVVGGKARDAAEEVKEAGRDVKDWAKEAGEDVKETIKETR